MANMEDLVKDLIKVEKKYQELGNNLFDNKIEMAQLLVDFYNKTFIEKEYSKIEDPKIPSVENTLINLSEIYSLAIENENDYALDSLISQGKEGCTSYFKILIRELRYRVL